ncbi:unnamed protein product [Gordionus sp. m RMFG-2023]
MVQDRNDVKITSILELFNTKPDRLESSRECFDRMKGSNNSSNNNSSNNNNGSSNNNNGISNNNNGSSNNNNSNYSNFKKTEMIQTPYNLRPRNKINFINDIMIDLQVNNYDFSFMIDTGSPVSSLPMKEFEKLTKDEVVNTKEIGDRESVDCSMTMTLIITLNLKK